MGTSTRITSIEIEGNEWMIANAVLALISTVVSIYLLAFLCWLYTGKTRARKKSLMIRIFSLLALFSSLIFNTLQWAVGSDIVFSHFSNNPISDCKIIVRLAIGCLVFHRYFVYMFLVSRLRLKRSDDRYWGITKRQHTSVGIILGAVSLLMLGVRLVLETGTVRCNADFNNCICEWSDSSSSTKAAMWFFVGLEFVIGLSLLCGISYKFRSIVYEAITHQQITVHTLSTEPMTVLSETETARDTPVINDKVSEIITLGTAARTSYVTEFGDHPSQEPMIDLQPTNLVARKFRAPRKQKDRKDSISLDTISVATAAAANVTSPIAPPRGMYEENIIHLRNLAMRTMLCSAVIVLVTVSVFSVAATAMHKAQSFLPLVTLVNSIAISIILTQRHMCRDFLCANPCRRLLILDIDRVIREKVVPRPDTDQNCGNALLKNHSTNPYISPDPLPLSERPSELITKLSAVRPSENEEDVPQYIGTGVAIANLIPPNLGNEYKTMEELLVSNEVNSTMPNAGVGGTTLTITDATPSADDVNLNTANHLSL